MLIVEVAADGGSDKHGSQHADHDARNRTSAQTASHVSHRAQISPIASIELKIVQQTRFSIRTQTSSQSDQRSSAIIADAYRR